MAHATKICFAIFRRPGGAGQKLYFTKSLKIFYVKCRKLKKFIYLCFSKAIKRRFKILNMYDFLILKKFRAFIEGRDKGSEIDTIMLPTNQVSAVEISKGFKSITIFVGGFSLTNALYKAYGTESEFRAAARYLEDKFRTHLTKFL